MHLPTDSHLPVNLLASSFSSTSATYKYYWLLSIIESVENNEVNIPKKNLFARMISLSWYTVNYFNVSFGVQDLIQDAVKQLKNLENISVDTNREAIFKSLCSTNSPVTKNLLFHFDKNVPHWFLSPWYPKRSKQEIYSLSQQLINNPIYSLEKEHININESWLLYLLKNAKIIKDFIYWNLALFLQVRNPNVPDIPNKLIKPALRSSLMPQRKFWDLILDEVGFLECIYTGAKLEKGRYDVEHFIPYSFVSHNQIWNLIPGDKTFNLKKNNKLPPLELYFDKFYKIQRLAIDIYTEKKPNDKLLQEYFYISPDLNKGLTRDKFYEVINPLITIASNNGFQYLSL